MSDSSAGSSGSGAARPGPGKPSPFKFAPAFVIVLVIVAVVLLRPGGTGSTPTKDAGPAATTSPVSGGAPSAPAPVASSGSAGGGTKVASAPPAAPPPQAKGGAASSPSLKIGAWNIEWLGKPEDRAQFAKGVAQDPAVMAEYIATSGAAIVGLAEIVASGPGTPIRSREIEATIDAIRAKTGESWWYVLYPGRQDGDQLTGVMWNTARVSAVNHEGRAWRQTGDTPWRVPIKEGRSSQGSRLWSRPPHAMKFRLGEGQSDIVVIMVHMKADYQGDFAKQRDEELAVLLDALPAVRSTFKDDDVVIIGDTNATSGTEAMLASATKAGFVDLNSRNDITTWRDGFTDRAFVPSQQPEFKERSFWVHSREWLSARRWKPGDFKKNLSDHYMVGTVVAVMPDDD